MSRNTNDTLSHYLNDLKHRSESVRLKAAKNLRIYVEAEAREMSRGTFSSFMTEITTKRIYELVSSTETHEKIGGIMAIDELIEVPCEDNETKIIRFANYLRMVFQQPVVETSTLDKASRALGHLARAGGAVTADFVEFELKRSIDWLQDESKGYLKRYAAVLVLKELATNSPVLFSPLIPAFFEHIWVAIQSDGEIVVREAAVEALRAVLAIIAMRSDETWYRHQWFTKIAEQMSEGFRVAEAASVHGSLLVVGELLRNMGTFMHSRFEETCKTVFAYKSHQHKLVQRTTIQLLPQLAHCHPEHFTRHWLDPSLAHLISVLKAGGDHYDVAFAAVGEIALAVGSAITPHTPTIIELVNVALPSTMSRLPKKHHGKSHEDTNGALRCVSKLAKAVGPSLAPQIESLVDQMFAGGLSRPLLDVLEELARSTPSLLPVVQTRLLSCISAVLSPSAGSASACRSGQPQRAPPRSGPGRPGLTDRMPATSALEDLRTPSGLGSVPGERSSGTAGSEAGGVAERAQAEILLALGALSALFGAENPRARQVVSGSVVGYFDHESPAVRREAALTVTRLLLPSLEQLALAATVATDRTGTQGAQEGAPTGHACQPLLPTASQQGRFPPDTSPGAQAQAVSGFSRRITLCQTHELLAVATILRRALALCASDPDLTTRQRVLESLDPRFDPFLCEPNCISLLAQALHDEALPVRRAVVQIMGRLTQHNPAYVVPALRKLLIQILTELEYSIDLRHKEQATELLTCMSLHAHRLVEPYVGAIAKCLIKKLREANAEGSLKLVAKLLEAIAELSEVSGNEVKPFLPELIPLLVDAIQDHGGSASHLKRELLEQAYRGLRMVVENTGYVTELYDRYPSLLPFLIDTLRSDVHTGDWQQRQQILRCIGALGARDPARFRWQGPAGLGPSAASPGGVALPGAGPSLAMTSAGSGHVALAGVGGRAAGRAASAAGGDERSGPMALLEGELEGGEAPAWPWLSSGHHFGEAGSGSTDTDRRTLFFAAHAVAGLLKMLSDVSLASLHAQVVQVLMQVILKSLHNGCAPFLPQIMAAFVQVIRSLDKAPERQALLGHLAELVRIAGARIGAYLPAIFEVISSIWHEIGTKKMDTDSIKTTTSLLTLLEEISACSRDALKAHLGALLPTILGFLLQNNIEQREVSRQALHSLVVFGPALGDFLHLVIPALVRRCEEGGDGNPSGDDARLREDAVRALGSLSTELHFPHLLSRVVHPLLRILETASVSSELKLASIDTLGHLKLAFSQEFSIFEPQIKRVLVRQRLLVQGALLLDPEHHQEHPRQHSRQQEQHLRAATAAISSMEQSGHANATCEAGVPYGGTSVREDRPSARPNQQSLRQAWEASNRSTKEDWVEWMRRLALELLRESGSPALRACVGLAQVYPPLSRELFHVSFLSSWLHLSDPYQDVLVRSLETALHSPNLPPDILQALLNLVEFMDRCGLPLPTDAKTLGGVSEKCHAYAKALHYKEMEFATSPTACVEALISINTQLQQTEAAQGVLVYAQKNLNVELREPWYERLQRWEDALEAYELRQLDHPSSLEWTRSRMRCLHELGEWPRLSQMSRSVWEREGAASDAVKQEVAPLAAAAEFHLRDWDRMALFVDALEGSRNSSYEGFLYSAILALHRENYRRASRLISRARETLDPELTALVGESYTRAYQSLVKVQQLTELEEIIKYKTTDREQTRQGIREMWANRLNGCQPSVDVWQAALQIRSIVVPPTEDVDTWLNFSALCRRSSRVDLAVKALEHLRQGDAFARDPRVIVAYLKNHYAAGCKRQACEMMRSFLAAQSLHHASDASEATIQTPTAALLGNAAPSAALLARCHLKMGLWTREVYEEEFKAAYFTDERVLKQVLTWFQSATDLAATDYKAWNTWAMANFQVVEAIEAAALRATPASAEAVGTEGLATEAASPRPGWPAVFGGAATGASTSYVLHAVKGFVKSVVLAKKTALQDILRLLTLWFKYAEDPEVEPALREAFDVTPLKAWLQVVPQILARLRSTKTHLRTTIHELLSRVATKYPQAVVFPLTVATKSTVAGLASAAAALLRGMHEDGSRDLVRQSEMVSEELIRISILWHEAWCEALEEASRLYYVESDPEAMIKVLQPLHEQMQQIGPQTMREITFQQAFSRELQEAWRSIQRFQKSRCKADTDQAWQSYYKVFQKIRKQVQGLSHLDMQSVSPKLLNARCLELAVPGTYTAEGEDAVITITSFSPSIEVVTSKQRPRILQLLGSNGKSYQFLLKGHEDLKQDERVMQLFGLINSFLEEHAESAKRDLSITRFAVVPLSANSGLIEWVGSCDTLHQLIKMYRKSRHVELSVEYQLMRSICSRCEELNVLQKVEVFRYALQRTSGLDLQQVLWFQSRNSEVWLSRRTTFCRSLAVMSMVGYILGLGDRHPSNLMIARGSGQVVHIDFGDCFEIAALREKYPEKIPFRLTRMLLNALEVSGVEGNYRYTCELVMCLLRSNKAAVMAMLEAFVFDPLITWRLLPAHMQQRAARAAVNHGEAPCARLVLGATSPGAALDGDRLQVARAVGKDGAAAEATASASTVALANEQGTRAADNVPFRSTDGARPAEGADGGLAEPEAAAAAAAMRPGPALGDFVCAVEPAEAEADPHLASVRGKQARQRQLRQHLGPEGVYADEGLLLSTARSIISRVYAKLNGTDFRREAALDVEAQVERLLQEATSHEHLCQCYVGWCPFW